MSIFIDGLVDHRVPDYQDRAAVLARLSVTVPVLARVSDYLSSVLPNHKDTDPTWIPVQDYTYFAYHGPGGFRVLFGRRVAVIGASCRHSAFATMSPLQAVYLAAFRSVAEALGAARLALISDQNDTIQDAAINDSASLDDCIELTRKVWGAPHARTEIIGQDMEAYNCRRSPVWYLETVPLHSAHP